MWVGETLWTCVYCGVFHRSSDLQLWHGGTAVPNISTYNVEAAFVDTPPVGMPPHKYVMILEPFDFMINNNTDGNLTGTAWHMTRHPAVPVHLSSCTDTAASLPHIHILTPNL